MEKEPNSRGSLAFSSALVLLRPKTFGIRSRGFRPPVNKLTPTFRQRIVSTATDYEHVLHCFGKVAHRVGLSVSQQQSLLKLSETLHRTNSLYNLTGIRTRHGIIAKHLIDALTLLPFLDEQAPNRIVDVGTGAGFPGLVIAISRPEWSMTLVDSVRKKVSFHEQIISDFGLRNVQSVWGRAEHIAKGQLRESFCIAVARSVAEMRVLAELTLPLVQVGGYVMAQKTVDAQHKELIAAENSIRLCGGQLLHVLDAWPSRGVEFVSAQDLPPLADLASNKIIVVKKERRTPAKYPRRAGVPKKTPL
ncbi:Ribosomal RNA small subunit methyltransferase G [Gracilariopsis chorda]|uniref:Ribosomal RNA small subunit methyltransferase G n=1 Tax=Gracilariopsis chorda TaxID=448386 RepID=A0A2V3IYX5_9FLOR|nr:Ribosomal RNA small subunit methyltransferase G [Gracilariopsis chorda]|eukprot:PXF47344.1 Ribosomal RNA small subunit methyltransferase G [Gracilariopsis chorda]